MFKLGIVYKNGVPINHRSLLKIIFNPLLRIFGFQIASLLDKNNKVEKILLMKTSRTKNFFNSLKESWFYNNEYDYIKEDRRWF